MNKYYLLLTSKITEMENQYSIDNGLYYFLKNKVYMHHLEIETTKETLREFSIEHNINQKYEIKSLEDIQNVLTDFSNEYAAILTNKIISNIKYIFKENLPTKKS